MKTICLTGGIASGKSTASSIFKKLGAKIIDADKLGHQTYEKGRTAHSALIRVFGKEICAADGEINRKKLGEIVFGDRHALKRLTDIVWPNIRTLAEKKIKEIRSIDQDQIIILEAAVLFEAGWETMGDETWVIEVDPEIAIERIMNRNGITGDQAKSRLSAQLSNRVRANKADVVIKNNGSPQSFSKKILAIWKSRV